MALPVAGASSESQSLQDKVRRRLLEICDSFSIRPDPTPDSVSGEVFLNFFAADRCFRPFLSPCVSTLWVNGLGEGHQ